MSVFRNGFVDSIGFQEPTKTYKKENSPQPSGILTPVFSNVSIARDKNVVS
jgi:hypothetical protein